jgi:hypothetical protein
MKKFEAKKIWRYYPFNLVRKSEKSADAHLWTLELTSRPSHLRESASFTSVKYLYLDAQKRFCLICVRFWKLDVVYNLFHSITLI